MTITLCPTLMIRNCFVVAWDKNDAWGSLWSPGAVHHLKKRYCTCILYLYIVIWDFTIGQSWLKLCMYKGYNDYLFSFLQFPTFGWSKGEDSHQWTANRERSFHKVFLADLRKTGWDKGLHRQFVLETIHFFILYVFLWKIQIAK